MSREPLRLAIIDEEHRSIHRELAKLMNAITLGLGFDDVLRSVNDVFRVTRLHFKHEESILKKIGFEGHEQHRREHNKIVTMLNKVLKLLDRDEKVTAFGLLREFRKVLIVHLQEVDEQYRDAVNRYAAEAGLPPLRPRIRVAIQNE